MILHLRAGLNAPDPGTLKPAVLDADHSGRMPRLTVLLLLIVVALAGCSEPVARQAPAATPSPPPGAPLDTARPKTGAYDTLLARQRAEEARLRAEIARARRSPTVEASLRVARLTGRISPALEASLRKDWAQRERHARPADGHPAVRARLRRRHAAHAGREPRADRGPAAADVPRPARQRALLGARADSRPPATARAPTPTRRSSSTTPAAACSSSRSRAGAARTRSPAPAWRRCAPRPRRTAAARVRWPRAWTG